MIEYIPELVDAGIDSFKVEGRIHALPKTVSSIVYIVRLCADMDLDIRRIFLCKIKYTRIRNNQRVRTYLAAVRIRIQTGQFFEIVRNPCKITVVCRNFLFRAVPAQ